MQNLLKDDKDLLLESRQVGAIQGIIRVPSR